MGRRQREWATRRRKWLIKELGGKCHKCGSKRKLELDHIFPTNEELRKMDSSSRMSHYYKEFLANNLQLLCQTCNSSKKRNVVDYRPVQNELDLKTKPFFHFRNDEEPF